MIRSILVFYNIHRLLQNYFLVHIVSTPWSRVSSKKEKLFHKNFTFFAKTIFSQNFLHFFHSRKMRKFRKIRNEKILWKNAKILQKKIENQLFATEYIAWLSLDIFNFENLQTSETLNLLKFNINNIIVKFLHIYQIYSFFEHLLII